MIIYIVIIEDRYEDVKLIPFATPEAAVSKASQIGRDRADDDEGYKEYDGLDAGFLFMSSYSNEGGFVSVVYEELVNAND